MPPRLAHKKSRRGCQRCKVRKVKCDEAQPVCSACQRHGVPCSYAEVTSHFPTRPPINDYTPSDGTNSQSTPPASRISGPTSPYDLDDTDSLDPEERRLLELKLLHYYLTVVAKTFPASQHLQIRDLWISDAIRHGFEHSFLINSIFAISALHASLETPDEKYLASPPFDAHKAPAVSDQNERDPRSLSDYYAKAHRMYLNLAVQEQRHALYDLKTSNADAVCLSSIVLSIIALKLIPSDQQNYRPPVQWLLMANSISAVVQATEPLMRDNSVINAIITLDDPNFRDVDAIFDPRFREPFQSILDFQPTGDEDEDIREIYTPAVTYVGSVYRGIEERESGRRICRRIMSFSSVLPRQFVTLLDMQKPRALVILAHLMAMAKYVEDVWWFRGAAEREVFGIQSILPQEWQWAMKWPMRTMKVLADRGPTDRQAVEVGN